MLIISWIFIDPNNLPIVIIWMKLVCCMIRYLSNAVIAFLIGCCFYHALITFNIVAINDYSITCFLSNKTLINSITCRCCWVIHGLIQIHVKLSRNMWSLFDLLIKLREIGLCLKWRAVNCSVNWFLWPLNFII